MRRVLWSLATSGLFLFSASAWGQSNACDLTGDGRVDASDVQASINMTLGISPCTANLFGANTCNIVVVQRVVNASMGGACVTGSGHSVTLNWTASSSPNITGQNVYRATVSGGPYTLLSSITGGTSFTDNAVQAGASYFYVITAVDINKLESGYSNEARAVVPTP